MGGEEGEVVSGEDGLSGEEEGKGGEGGCRSRTCTVAWWAERMRAVAWPMPEEPPELGEVRGGMRLVGWGRYR